MNSRSVAVRLCATGLAASLAFSGCAYSMVSEGLIRPEPLRDVAARTGFVRRLPVPAPLPAEVIAQTDLPDLLRSLLADQWTEAELADYQQALTTIGVWPSDRVLLDEFVKLSQQEIAGLYVPEHGTLYVVKDAKRPFSLRIVSALLRRDIYLEFVISHEIVHLLQHRRYPWVLEEDGTWKAQDDFTLAVQTAIEGDAMRYGMEALSPGRPLPEPDDFRAAVPADVEGDAPALLRLTLTLPYVEGYGLSHAEGMGLLEAAPASTEQVLHPERRHEPFAVADLSALAETLPEGCRVLGENTLGEVGISVLFRDLGEPPDPASWQGWHGDRYLAAHCDEGPSLFWWTSWDTEAEAVEFAAAYRGIARAVAARAGLSSPPSVRREGAAVLISTPRFHDVSLASLRTGSVADAAELRAFFGTPYVDPNAPHPATEQAAQ